MVPALGLCVLHGVEVVDTYNPPGEVSPEAPCAVPLRALGAGGPIELAVALLASSLFIFPLLFLVPFPFNSLLAFEAKLVFFIREMHLQHSECPEHSQNSRIKQAAGVEMTVSAKDAKTTAASSDFSKHSQNSLSKGKPNADLGEVKTTFGDSDSRCLRKVSEFLELSPNLRVVTEASEGRHQHTKPVCVGEPSK